MRDFKFRAWNRIVKRFQFFSFQDIEKQKGQIQWQNLQIDQFTGLRDLNGKKIFESDIILFKVSRENENKILEERTFITAVVYEDDCFLVSEMQYNDTPLSGFNKVCKIVGNIHENPKLVKQW